MFHFPGATTFCFAIPLFLAAQVSEPVPPVSFTHYTDYDVPAVVMPPVDVPALLAEDAETEGLEVPYRFGYPFDVSYGPENSGQWTPLAAGGRVWRLRIESPGAFSLNLIFDPFELPPGGKVWVYNDDGSSILGAFTERNNKPRRVLATGLVRGEACTVEYYEPEGAEGRGRFRISRIVHGYKNVFRGPWKGFGASGSCNVNVICAEGEDWKKEARAVGMILVDGGTSVCTGALLNNVREDMTPYFLTAAHCTDGDEDSWVVVFNYESPGCESADGSMNDSVSGSVLLARYAVSDFALIRLDEKPPLEYNVYYAGWSAEPVAPTSSVTIHHPHGDVKKISFDFDPAVSSSYPWDPWEKESHWKIVDWDVGTTEPGSSGSPLFDQNHRVVGQLTGGEASCSNNAPDYYGKLSYSWNTGTDSGSRLRDWLDPDGTGVLVLDGLSATDRPPEIKITDPSNDDVVSGVVEIVASASDDFGVDRVDFYVNNVLKVSVHSAPYTYSWNTAELPEGAYVLRVVAVDTGGLSAEDSVTVIRRRVGVMLGDSNCDSAVNLADAVCILDFLFGPSEETACKRPCCAASQETNGDGRIDLADAITLLSFLFNGGFLTEGDGTRVGPPAECRFYERTELKFPCETPCN